MLPLTCPIKTAALPPPMQLAYNQLTGRLPDEWAACKVGACGQSTHAFPDAHVLHLGEKRWACISAKGSTPMRHICPTCCTCCDSAPASRCVFPHAEWHSGDAPCLQPTDRASLPTGLAGAQQHAGPVVPFAGGQSRAGGHTARQPKLVAAGCPVSVRLPASSWHALLGLVHARLNTA